MGKEQGKNVLFERKTDERMSVIYSGTVRIQDSLEYEIHMGNVRMVRYRVGWPGLKSQMPHFLDI